MPYLIHVTTNPETGEPLKEYYTQIPIPEGTEFMVQYGEHQLKFKLVEHWVTNELYALIELINVVKKPTICRPVPKRPIAGERNG